MAAYVTAVSDAAAARACGESLAALWAGDDPLLLDASVWPNRDDAAACAEAPARALVEAFLDPVTAGAPLPWVLPQVCGEAIGMLQGLAGAAGAGDEFAQACGDAVALLRRGAHTPGGLTLDAGWVRKCVRFLDALDRSEGCSKEPGAKGRRTDLRLVATALAVAWRAGRPANLATRDEDVRRLTMAATAWAVAHDGARPAVQVWKLDRAAGRYRCFFDGAAGDPGTLSHPTAPAVTEAWAALH